MSIALDDVLSSGFDAGGRSYGTSTSLLHIYEPVIKGARGHALIYSHSPMSGSVVFFKSSSSVPADV